MALAFSTTIDINKIAKKNLERLGLTYSNKKEAVLQLFNWENRYIQQKKRQFFESTQLVVPEHLKQGYANLKHAIEHGNNINQWVLGS